MHAYSTCIKTLSIIYPTIMEDLTADERKALHASLIVARCQSGTEVATIIFCIEDFTGALSTE